MLDYFHSRLRVIEDEFGLQFLERVPKLENAKRFHPVRRRWRLAKTFLNSRSRGQLDLRNPDLAYATQIANAIEMTRNLPGYNKEIRGELLIPNNYDKFGSTIYEMLTAASLVDCNAGDIEFVERNEETGVRLPDLKIARDGQIVWGECSVRGLAGVPTPKILWSVRHANAKRTLLEHVGPSMDIHIILPRGDEESILAVIEWALATLPRGEAGNHLNDEIGAAVLLVDNRPTQNRAAKEQPVFAPPPPPDVGPRMVRLGLATSNSPVQAINFYCFDANRFNEVKSTFTVKRQRKQIPKGQIGVVFIDCDLSKIHPPNRIIYLWTMAWLLGRQAWKWGENSRIGGLCVAASHSLTVEETDGFACCKSDVLGFLLRRITDTNPLPEWFTLRDPANKF